MNVEQRRLEKGKGQKGPLTLPGCASNAHAGVPLFFLFPAFFLLFCFICVPRWSNASVHAGQRIVDRIVAAIEGEPVTASELADLGKFQQLLGGAAPDEKELLRRRVELWIISSDAQAARFPPPAAAEIQREITRLRGQFASPADYQARLEELGLRSESVHRLLEQQFLTARYLDARFRPAVQVDESQIELYFRDELAPALAKCGQPLPALDTVRQEIRELLMQRGISERAGRWLDETRARTRVVLHGARDVTDTPR